jgi:hypothetical protein
MINYPMVIPKDIIPWPRHEMMSDLQTFDRETLKATSRVREVTVGLIWILAFLGISLKM